MLLTLLMNLDLAAGVVVITPIPKPTGAVMTFGGGGIGTIDYRRIIIDDSDIIAIVKLTLKITII